MSEKEKKEIGDFKYWIDTNTEKGVCHIPDYICKNILNLIEKQQEQLQQKDKVIDLMAEMITEAKFCYFKKEKGGELLGRYRCYNKDEWIEYFTKKEREV